MSASAVEAELVFLGDERAAEAIVLENDGLHNTKEIKSRAEDAQEQASDAA